MVDGQVTDIAEGSAVPEPSAPNIVRLPNGSVTLHPTVTLPLGIAALSVIKQGGGQAAVEGGLAEVYLRFGIAAWSFNEAITPENIARLLPYAGGGLEVAEAADALYSEDVFRPLVARLSSFSRTTPMVGPMSPSSAGGSMPRTPSGRSSRNGTAGQKSAAPAR